MQNFKPVRISHWLNLMTGLAASNEARNPQEITRNHSVKILKNTTSSNKESKKAASEFQRPSSGLKQCRKSCLIGLRTEFLHNNFTSGKRNDLQVIFPEFAFDCASICT